MNQATFWHHADNIKSDRTAEDLLFQVLLDWGVDLPCPSRQKTIDGRRVLRRRQRLVACFDRGIDEDFVKELAKRKPLRAVFRDSGFDSDSAEDQRGADLQAALARHRSEVASEAR